MRRFAATTTTQNAALAITVLTKRSSRWAQDRHYSDQERGWCMRDWKKKTRLVACDVEVNHR